MKAKLKTSTRFLQAAATERKADLTRARLMDGAINVIARKGAGAASIVEITRQSGVANGTFYLYFKNKTELMDALGVAVVDAVLTAAHDRRYEDGDPARMVARHMFAFLSLAAMEPNWAPLIIEMLGSAKSIRANLLRGVRGDVEAGARAGRFPAPMCEETTLIVAAVARIGLERLLALADPREAKSRAIAAALRVVGLAFDEAEAIAAETVALAVWKELEFPSLDGARDA